jgi:hypothetical protein
MMETLSLQDGKSNYSLIRDGYVNAMVKVSIAESKS